MVSVTAKQLWFFAFPFQPLEVSLHCYFRVFVVSPRICLPTYDVRNKESYYPLYFRSSSNVFRKTLSSGQPFNVLTSSFLGFYVTTREIPQADTKVFASFCILQFILLSEQLFLSFVNPFNQSNYSFRYIYVLVFRNRCGYRFVTRLGLLLCFIVTLSTHRFNKLFV